ncbi:MAG TPA: hypothetical protein ENI76_03885 [Ignavibacteria bacterium]|nr:hypothetical protein [Ignavibacteria bacterium]
MGRSLIEIPDNVLERIEENGIAKKDASEELGISKPTLARLLGDLKLRQGDLHNYEAFRNLHLTSMQVDILLSISPIDIAEASLKDKIGAFKILRDKQLVSEGKPTEIKGLLGYLIAMEKEESVSVKASRVKLEDLETIDIPNF